MTQPISYAAAPMRGGARGTRPATAATVRPTRTATVTHTTATTVTRSSAGAAVLSNAAPMRPGAKHAGAPFAAAVTGSGTAAAARPVSGLLWPRPHR